jgi:glutathione S-transferase
MTAKYTLILGTKDWSSWSLRPYVAIRAIGVPFEEVVIRLRQTQHPSSKEQILKYSPAGRVPVLRIEDGGRTHTVWDSLAICETLAERHPEAKLWPQDPMTRATARSYAAEMHSGFPDVRDQLSMDFARRVPAPALRAETREQLARILEMWTDALAKHSSAGGFLFGGFSVADCMFAPVVSRFVTYGIDVPMPVKTYAERMFSLLAMRDWEKAAKAEVDAGVA